MERGSLGSTVEVTWRAHEVPSVGSIVGQVCLSCPKRKIQASMQAVTGHRAKACAWVSEVWQDWGDSC